MSCWLPQHPAWPTLLALSGPKCEIRQARGTNERHGLLPVGRQYKALRLTACGKALGSPWRGLSLANGWRSEWFAGDMLLPVYVVERNIR